jgi:hypothetical protein
MGGFASLHDVDVVDTDHMWGVRSAGDPGGSTNHQIWRSSDGGVTWQPTSEPGETYYDLQFADTQHGWFISRPCTGGCTSALATTADGGASWTELDLATTFNRGDRVFVRDMLFADARLGWMSADACRDTECSSAIWGTTDGGLSWDLQSEGEHMSGVLAAVDDGTAWLATDLAAGFGGASPSRTYLYSTAGEPVPEEPVAFPQTGTNQVASGNAWLPFVVLGVLGAASLFGVWALRRWRRVYPSKSPS